MMIQVSNLTKRFGKLVALDGVSFQVAAGEAVALWGANGAGKTTALRCLLNLMPYEGQITVAGLDAVRQDRAVRRLVGFVPQELTFHDDMTVRETFSFYARLKKVPAGYDFTPLLERLSLVLHLDKRVRDLSGGLKQRLALALALLADPPILLLDEPTSNLDVTAREDFLELLRELKAAGKTLIFTSHHLDEMGVLADRVLVLADGRLVADCPPHRLAQEMGWQTTLHLTMPAEGIDPALEMLTAQGMPVSRNGRGIRVQVAPDQKALPLRMLEAAGIEVNDFTLE